MSSFSERERAFENYFAHQQELHFQIIILRTKIFAYWIAEQIELDETLKKLYIRETVQLLIQEPGDDHLLHKALTDLNQKGITITLNDIEKKLNECYELARQELLAEPF